MKSQLDNFSKQAATYKKYRPTYPTEIYQTLIKLTKKKKQCWDCGTGNGQVAVQLANHFETVYATDISQKQLDHAEKKSNIIYRLERAEKTNFADNQFDLITVAQAVHWFDFDTFNKEVKRVGKNGGIISIWGYGLLKINPTINRIIDHFYQNIIGPYWNDERKHIDHEYQSIPFDFKEIPTKNDYKIIVNWNVKQLEGYFNSWSSVQHFKKQHPDKNPVNEVIDSIKKHWEKEAVKKITFPVFMRNGIIEK